MADAKSEYLKPTRIIMVLLLVLATAGCKSDGTTGTHRVVIGEQTFDLELAMTNAARFRGLSGREKVAADGGMLFVFPSEAEREFVMRECRVPIDILFLGPTGEVLTTHAMQVEPAGTPEADLPGYSSGGKSAVVIELAGGTVARLGVEPGDRISLPIAELKRRAW